MYGLTWVWRVNMLLKSSDEMEADITSSPYLSITNVTKLKSPTFFGPHTQICASAPHTLITTLLCELVIWLVGANPKAERDELEEIAALLLLACMLFIFDGTWWSAMNASLLSMTAGVGGGRTRDDKLVLVFAAFWWSLCLFRASRSASVVSRVWM